MRVATSIILFLASTVSFSGAVAPTAHSRANCGGFNESVHGI